MDSMPVAPDMLDIAKSRSRDPDSWGYWKAENQNFVFAWNVDQKSFVSPSGDQEIAKLFPPGTKLDGAWEMSKTFTSLNFSSVSKWGVVLSKNGRFEKYQNNFNLAGGESSGGVGPMVAIRSGDEGSQSVVSGANIGGGTRTTNNNPKSDRQGWYEFDGYNLSLKFDNGKVERLLTFSVGNDYRTIWFNNGPLFRKSE